MFSLFSYSSNVVALQLFAEATEWALPSLMARVRSRLDDKITVICRRALWRKENRPRFETAETVYCVRCEVAYVISHSGRGAITLEEWRFRVDQIGDAIRKEHDERHATAEFRHNGVLNAMWLDVVSIDLSKLDP